MKAVIALFLFVLLGCSTPPDRRVSVHLVNDTAKPITFVATSGLFSTRITLAPGASWVGWVDRYWVAGSARIEVE